MSLFNIYYTKTNIIGDKICCERCYKYGYLFIIEISEWVTDENGESELSNSISICEDCLNKIKIREQNEKI